MWSNQQALISNTALVAEKTAQASIITRREETAATKSLAVTPVTQKVRTYGIYEKADTGRMTQISGFLLCLVNSILHADLNAYPIHLHTGIRRN